MNNEDEATEILKELLDGYVDVEIKNFLDTDKQIKRKVVEFSLNDTIPDDVMEFMQNLAAFTNTLVRCVIKFNHRLIQVESRLSKIAPND